MIDYIPYAVLYIPMTIFITANLYFLIPFTFSPTPPTPLPYGKHKEARERQIPYDFTYMWILKNKTDKTESTQDTESYDYLNYF